MACGVCHAGHGSAEPKSLAEHRNFACKV
ncbi:cytochrome c3 family protein [Heyndrickxia sporothermodurans]